MLEPQRFYATTVYLGARSSHAAPREPPPDAGGPHTRLSPPSATSRPGSGAIVATLVSALVLRMRSKRRPRAARRGH